MKSGSNNQRACVILEIFISTFVRLRIIHTCIYYEIRYMFFECIYFCVDIIMSISCVYLYNDMSKTGFVITAPVRYISN